VAEDLRLISKALNLIDALREEAESMRAILAERNAAAAALARSER